MRCVDRPGKKFCTSCGAPVVAPVTTEQPPVAAAPLVTPPPSGPYTAGGRRRLVIIGTGVLALVAIALIAAFAAFGRRTYEWHSSTSTWPRKDVNDFHRTCSTTGTSDFTCGQELTCAQAHVQSATYEHYYEDRNTADGKQLSHPPHSHRARFTKTCPNSWNSRVQLPGWTTGSGQCSDRQPRRDRPESDIAELRRPLHHRRRGTDVRRQRQRHGTWTLVSNRARNPGEKQDEANVVLNNDGTMTAIPPAVGTQSAAQDAATPESSIALISERRWDGDVLEGEGDGDPNPCLIVAFTLLPDGSIDGVFPFVGLCTRLVRLAG